MKLHNKKIIIIITTLSLLSISYLMCDTLYQNYARSEFATLLEKIIPVISFFESALLTCFIIYVILKYQSFWIKFGIIQGYMFVRTITYFVCLLLLELNSFKPLYAMYLTIPLWIERTAFFFLFLGFHRLFLHKKGEH